MFIFCTKNVNGQNTPIFTERRAKVKETFKSKIFNLYIVFYRLIITLEKGNLL